MTERVMTPLETLARVAAMVPPPRYPLLRFHGVLAPRHRWRKRVVPRPPPARAAACTSMLPELPAREATGATATSRPAHDAGDGRAAFVLDVVPGVATATLTTTGAAEQVAPNLLSVTHWDRILQGELYATGSRIDWRTLLKRTFDVDLRYPLHEPAFSTRIAA